MERSFRLKEEHIKLLGAAYIGWNDCEFGAPTIDGKRPYGNSSVIPDIAEILAIDPDDDGDFSPELESELTQLHYETQTALQVILATRSFEPGLYACSRYGIDWRRVGD